ncbi:hypothetical protein SLEP1_g20347 [Rubroshorea leprosula]|uniref:Uncharacterized protein n=2 Tax=Rubroshorea leprosula TaxID=152421 RepID=A0AAV5JEB3_9ROSI|nr:hypothetical protein SLEP1_g20347 [Rubroshorea leprosula]
MGRSPCCDKVGLKKGPWTPEEDQKLLAYIEEHGHGSWRALPLKAGLQRCGKSCRLRWTNYLRPDIKRGKFSQQEEQTIIQLHALLGNRWSAIATHLPKRTDNEIKNYWNTHLKKRLAKMGIDPITHKPKSDALISINGQSKSAANLNHMAQWESARLEAEARLVRESKLRSSSFQQDPAGFCPSGLASGSAPGVSKTAAWIIGGWTKSNEGHSAGILNAGYNGDLESPTSTLTFSENVPPVMCSTGLGLSSMPIMEFAGSTLGSSETGVVKEERNSTHLPSYKEAVENSLSLTTNLHRGMSLSMETAWTSESLRARNADVNNAIGNVIEEGFTNLLLSESLDRSNLLDSGEESKNSGGGSLSGNSDGGNRDSGSDYFQDNKNYWNNILNLVNSSPSDSPMFYE